MEDLEPHAHYHITTKDGERKEARYVGQVYAGFGGNLEALDLHVFVDDEGRHEAVTRDDIYFE